MDEKQATAILRKSGVHWPHVSRADIDTLLTKDTTSEAIKTLLATVPTDDDELEVVTKTAEDGEVLETKKITNPTPMYKRLGFAERSDLDAKLAVPEISEELEAVEK